MGLWHRSTCQQEPQAEPNCLACYIFGKSSDPRQSAASSGSRSPSRNDKITSGSQGFYCCDHISLCHPRYRICFLHICDEKGRKKEKGREKDGGTGVGKERKREDQAFVFFIGCFQNG